MSVSTVTACLLQESEAIRLAATRLDPLAVEQTICLLERSAEQRSKLVITGVGKSGIVARKIAATFSSTGLMAIYLNPLDALHGDLGVVSPDDAVLLLSNSGSTTELLALMPHFRRRGNTCIAMVGRCESPLAAACELVLDASVDREVCPLNLAPTASTAVAMAIGDALAVAWMARRGISAADFAINHPAGSLGRQLTLTASDLMIPREQTQALASHSSLSQVITALTAAGIGACWVSDQDQSSRLAGLITDGDLRRALQHRPAEEWANLNAAHLMTTDPITVRSDALAVDAMAQMERNRRKPISVLPVVDHQGALLGLLRLHDLVQAGLSR